MSVATLNKMAIANCKTHPLPNQPIQYKRKLFLLKKYNFYTFTHYTIPQN